MCWHLPFVILFFCQWHLSPQTQRMFVFSSSIPHIGKIYHHLFKKSFKVLTYSKEHTIPYLFNSFLVSIWNQGKKIHDFRGEWQHEPGKNVRLVFTLATFIARNTLFFIQRFRYGKCKNVKKNLCMDYFRRYTLNFPLPAREKYIKTLRLR